MWPTVRHCLHCDKDIARDAFSAHLQHHAQLQERCHLSGERQYGAFYRSQPRETAQADPNTQSTEDSQRPIQQPSLARLGVYPCQFCPASFATLQQSQHHQSSGDCTANFIVLWVLVYDSSQPRGYRIEERHEPCKTKDWLFKCRKCDLVYATEDDLALHAKTHTVNPTTCEHCQKEFQSDYELRAHYEWHWDVQMQYEYEDYPPNDEAIPPEKPPRMALLRPRQDGEIVALSFVSKEDLLAPFTAPETGKFQEVNEAGGVPLWDPYMGIDFPSTSMKIPPQLSKKRIDTMLEYLHPALSKRFLDELLDSVDGRSLKGRFTDLSYRNWKTDTPARSHILLISGTQCCGKSTLAAGVVADLQDYTTAIKSEPSNDVGIIYFFFDKRTENTRTTSAFIRTLIAQLFIQRPELCNSIYLPHRPLVAGVPDDHLLQALASLLSHFPLTFVIIDGLEMADDAADLVTKINTLIHTPRVHLKILITARQGSTFPGLFSTMAVQHSKIQMLPHEVEENMRSYVKSFLSRQSYMLRQRAKGYVDQLIKNSDNNFLCLRNSLERLKSAPFLHIGISLKPLLQKVDNPFAEKLSILQSHPQSLLQTSISILQVLRALAEPPSVARLKAVLKGSNVEHVIKHCLQGIVGVKGNIVRFSCPQVCGYLTAGTTSPGTSKASQSISLEINEIKGHTTIACSALECICSSKFNEVIQHLADRGEVALNMHESFLALNWRRHVVRSSRNAALLGGLVKLFRSEQCHKWYMELSRLLPVLAVKDIFDHELWQWLNTSSHGVDTSVVLPLLENLRSLVLQQITITKPPDIPALLRLTTSLAYVHADTGYYSTAESLLRSNLKIVEMWCPEDNRKGFPLYIFGHTIENGQLVTGHDRLGREKAFGVLALKELISTYFHRHSTYLLNEYRHAARRNPRMNKLDYDIPQHFLWDNTDRASDSALALVIILRRQGKFDEASEVALRDHSQFEEDRGHLVLNTCNGGTPADSNVLRGLVWAKVDGLPKEPAAITAIENLGRFHLPEEPPYNTIVSQRYFEAALEQRMLTDDPLSPEALKTMKALTAIYLLHNEASKVHEMFAKFGTPSIVQLRQMKPSIPHARLNFALVLLTSGIRDLAAEILEELTEREYDEFPEARDGRVTAKALINLAALRIAEGNNEAAEGLLRNVMNNPRALSPNEQAVAKANLSTALSRMGKEEVSEQMHLENRRWTEGVEVSSVPLLGGSVENKVGFYSLVRVWE